MVLLGVCGGARSFVPQTLHASFASAGCFCGLDQFCERNLIRLTGRVLDKGCVLREFSDSGLLVVASIEVLILLANSIAAFPV